MRAAQVAAQAAAQAATSSNPNANSGFKTQNLHQQTNLNNKTGNPVAHRIQSYPHSFVEILPENFSFVLAFALFDASHALPNFNPEKTHPSLARQQSRSTAISYCDPGKSIYPPAPARVSYPKTMSTSSGSPESWISSFCSLLGHEYFAEVSEDFIEDDFNLTGLQTQVPMYKEALEVSSPQPPANPCLALDMLLTRYSSPPR